MSNISAFIQKIEAGATHLVSVIETDAAVVEQRVVAAIHVMGGNMIDAYKKVETDTIAEVNRIEAEATAAKQKLAAKLAAVKTALGV